MSEATTVETVQGSAHDPRWLDPLEASAWRSFIDGSQRLMEVLNRCLSERDGLSMDDYRILVMLSESAGAGIRMSELADGVTASRSKLTHQVRRLEDAGLVRRDECSSDRRGVNAFITEKGKHTLEAAAPGHVADVRRFMIDGLSREQLQTVAEVFEYISEASLGMG